MNRRFAFALLPLLLLGCAHDAPLGVPDVPTGAIDVKEGVGRLFYQSPRVGTIYVYDADTATVIFSQPIDPPERFILDPRLGVATVEGRPTFADPSRYPIKIGDHTIQQIPIVLNHTHRLYFSPGKHAMATSQP